MKRRIVKIFQKIAAEDGSVIDEIRDVASRDQNGNVFRGRQQVGYGQTTTLLFHCVNHQL